MTALRILWKNTYVKGEIRTFIVVTLIKTGVCRLNDNYVAHLHLRLPIGTSLQDKHEEKDVEFKRMYVNEVRELRGRLPPV